MRRACARGVQTPASLQRQRLTWVAFPPLTAQFAYGLGIIKNLGWIGHDGDIPGYTSEQLRPCREDLAGAGLVE
jgi:hypothetical protein